MNSHFDNIYRFYGLMPPVNKNQGLYLNLHQIASKYIIFGYVESESLKSYLPLNFDQRKELLIQDNEQDS
jgi:hypothetical protein